jgi:succinoglycan biosynthesis protein ExoO
LVRFEVTAKPEVSVLMANRNGARHVEEAIRSALDQDLEALEVVVVDDRSDDDSLERILRFAEQDRRVRLEQLREPAGPGAARNRALELARGRWAAVVDSDDLMHPARLARLVSQADGDRADIALDDLLVFHDDGSRKAERFLRGDRARQPTWLTPEDFLLETRLFAGGLNLGYLKPLVRMEAWRRSGVRYDPDLPIGEDHDLLLRLLGAGLRSRIYPSLGYFYRKHRHSTSHRLSEDALAQIDRAQERFADTLGNPPPRMTRALAVRSASIKTAQAFTAAVDALKQRRPLAAAGAVVGRPQALWLFRMPIAAAALRATARVAPARGRMTTGRAWFICRQRLVGHTNGSSTYLLQLAQTARAAGLSPRLLQPTPRILGRWPVLRLRPEMRVFETIDIRGVVRIGPLVISRDPGVYAEAAREVLARGLARLGVSSAWVGARRAPYAPAAPWEEADKLYVARALQRNAEVVVADYAWQTEALAYALSPGARTAVVMHDLFHRRARTFDAAAARDSVASLDRCDEARLLGRADVVVAIQKSEAAEVKGLALRGRILVAPMSVRSVRAPQPGNGQELLFVGSDTAPNAAGVQWLVERIWPRIRALEPGAALTIAGSVSRSSPRAAPGVRQLGFVDDLDTLYARAGLVISPLRAGSGLKIKLIEALAHGKACLVTPVTLQGVEAETAGAVEVADSSDAFVNAAIRLMRDDAARSRLGTRGLEVVHRHFEPDRAHRDWAAWLAGRATVAASPPSKERDRTR